MRPHAGTMILLSAALAIAMPASSDSLAAAGDGTSEPRGSLESSPAVQSADESFLGFDVGEERRYQLGPPGVLRAGEAVTWGIRLDRLESEGEHSVGVFELTHQDRRRGVMLAGGIMVDWQYSGVLRVNEFGFPEHLSFSMYEQHSGESPWRGETMTASYTLDGNEFYKTVQIPEGEWEFDIPIASHNDLDLEVPTGIFLFRPRAEDTNFFSQPALLDLAVPDVLPDEWEQRYMFFRPAYPVRYPDARYARRDRDRLRAIKRYYVKHTVKLGEEMRMEIGDRTLNVRKLDISGASREAFVDEFGRIVRINVERDPETLKERYIRILFPSEY